MLFLFHNNRVFLNFTFLFLLILLLALESQLSFPLTSQLWDLGSFHYSGLQALQSKNPYSWESVHLFRLSFDATLTGPNVNSPVSLFFFVPLAVLPLASVVWSWYASQLLCMLAAIYFTVRENIGNFSFAFRSLTILPLLALSGFWYSIELHQIYIFFLLLLILAIDLRERADFMSAGLFLGLISAFKPQFLIAPFVLFFTGEKRIAFWSGLFCLLFHALAVYTFGIDVYPAWIAAVVEKSASLQNEFLLQMSVYNVINLFVGDQTTQVVCISLLTLYLIQLMRKAGQFSFKDKLSLSLAGPLLFLPYAWLGYMIWLLPSIADHLRNRLVFGATLALCIPFYIIYPVGLELHERGNHALSLLYPFAFICLVVGIYSAAKKKAATGG